MIGMNEDTGYWCQVNCTLETEHLVTLPVSGKLNITDLEAIEFEVMVPDGRSVLMAVNHDQGSISCTYKIGIALPVFDEVAYRWS